jgi:hypothetical protein
MSPEPRYPDILRRLANFAIILLSSANALAGPMDNVEPIPHFDCALIEIPFDSEGFMFLSHVYKILTTNLIDKKCSRCSIDFFWQ